jgi:hypothetical protein
MLNSFFLLIIFLLVCNFWLRRLENFVSLAVYSGSFVLFKFEISGHMR